LIRYGGSGLAMYTGSAQLQFFGKHEMRIAGGSLIGSNLARAGRVKTAIIF
jgi:hypothetical protein